MRKTLSIIHFDNKQLKYLTFGYADGSLGETLPRMFDDTEEPVNELQEKNIMPHVKRS